MTSGLATAGSGPSALPSRRALCGFDALDFNLADVRDGLRPYLAIYPIAVRGPDQRWNEVVTGLPETYGYEPALAGRPPFPSIATAAA